MTITQTLSDGAQRNTIAFDGLAFITGNLGADSFFPPGKVADFWGFQYLRDNDPTGLGHNTDFLTRAALDMLYVLTPAQRAELIALAESQVNAINQYAEERFVLMDAFRRVLDGDPPAGASGLDKDAVQAYSAQLYRLDGEISYERAQVMGAQIGAFTADQRAYLNAMVGQGMLDWPVVDEPEELQGLEHDAKVAVMTYAGDMFNWYAGSVGADVYFCPERQGTYFGSFYMKDAPAVGNPGYSIPTTMTAEMGEAFLQVLTPEQAASITGLVEDQKPSLYTIVERRDDVATLLRQFMTGGLPDESVVLSLMEDYGALDGDIVYRYATAFAQVAQSLTEAQQAELDALRLRILGEDFLFPTGAYLYAEPIRMPTIPDSDFLFTASQTATLTYPVVDTGQGKCYNALNEIACPAEDMAFYGQDAQFTGNQPSYTGNSDGTVTDNVTGMMWSQTPDTDGDGNIDADDKFIQSEAVIYCEDLSLAGHDDWQLPSIKQLYSLMDFRGTDPPPEGSNTSGLIPFIEADYFAFAYGDTTAGERIIDAQFASSTLYVGTVMNRTQAMFGLNLADGRIKGYPTSKTFYVYCVRNTGVYGVNDFHDNGDPSTGSGQAGTITDNATGLTWAQDDNGEGVTWEEALAWVAQKNAENYLGYSDWRLPNVKELQSLLDYSRSPDTTNSAAIDPLFNATSITNEAGQTDYPFYWSSTTFLRSDGSATDAVYVAFGRGLGSMDNASIIDVHGAGCQRSDPKDGDPAEYPTWGFGPQGDLRRVFNYVRLVRGGVSATPEGGTDGEIGNVESQRPDASQAMPPNQSGALGNPPPQEAVDACTAQPEGASCQFSSPKGIVTGVCAQVQQQSACVPEDAPGSRNNTSVGRPDTEH
ncbi:MAG: DUF1566 domain-containing protein [Anaerolineae bacterium]|nr:DUF1566 domain-containing protein [Anaerolineae bacterium]